MAILKIWLDPVVFTQLAKQAAAERRPVPWQAEVMLRQALDTSNIRDAQDVRRTSGRKRIVTPTSEQAVRP